MCDTSSSDGGSFDSGNAASASHDCSPTSTDTDGTTHHASHADACAPSHASTPSHPVEPSADLDNLYQLSMLQAQKTAFNEPTGGVNGSSRPRRGPVVVPSPSPSNEVIRAYRHSQRNSLLIMLLAVAVIVTFVIVWRM